MTLFEKLTANAKANPQRIVLPEGTEPRTLTAADRIIADGIAKIILIGDPVEILAMAKELKLTHIPQATIVNPADEAVIDKYAPLFFDLRKSKGITMEEAPSVDRRQGRERPLGKESTAPVALKTNQTKKIFSKSVDLVKSYEENFKKKDLILKNGYGILLSALKKRTKLQ